MVEQSEIDAVTFGLGQLPLEHLDFFEIAGDSGAREAMLSVFRSTLGSALQSRTSTEMETSDIRTTVSRMSRLASQTDAGFPDDYLVELVDGDEEDFRVVPPSRRVVSGLEHAHWQTQELIRIRLS